MESARAAAPQSILQHGLWVRDVDEGLRLRTQLDVGTLRQRCTFNLHKVAVLNAQILHHPVRHQHRALVGYELENAAVKFPAIRVVGDLEKHWVGDFKLRELSKCRGRQHDFACPPSAQD